MIGLGGMGGNMVRRLLKGGHECVVFSRSPSRVSKLAKEGADGASSLEELLTDLIKRGVQIQLCGATADTKDLLAFIRG